MSPVEIDEVKKQLDEYLSKVWIRPSTSLYGTHILFARKINAILRICIDYSALSQ